MCSFDRLSQTKTESLSAQASALQPRRIAEGGGSSMILDAGIDQRPLRFDRARALRRRVRRARRRAALAFDSVVRI